MYILGIESSCDDTSAAVIQDNVILSNVIASQKIHAEYGGVVPELASRAHQQNIIPVIDTALKRAGIGKEQLSAIAFTNGPGLLGSLLVGNSFAKSMAFTLGIPLVQVNHLQAHVLAHFLDKPGETKPKPRFPFLCLTVSGGHTLLLQVNDYFDMSAFECQTARHNHAHIAGAEDDDSVAGHDISDIDKVLDHACGKNAGWSGTGDRNRATRSLAATERHDNSAGAKSFESFTIDGSDFDYRSLSVVFSTAI